MTTGKTIALTRRTFVCQVMSLLFHMLSRLVILFFQEARHGTTDWFIIWEEVQQGCILSLWLFNLHAEYSRRNAKLDETQIGIKIAGRNIDNLR